MGVIRKLRLLRRIRRYRAHCDDAMVNAAESSRSSLGQRLRQKLRKYRLARRINRIRRADYDKIENDSRVSTNLKRSLRVYRLARRIGRRRAAEAKIACVGNSGEDKNRLREMNRRKRSRIYSHLKNNLIHVLTLRYSFKSPNNIFTVKQILSIVFYGIAYFLIAYLFVYLAHDLAKSLSGMTSGITMKMYYYDTFPVYDPNAWTSQLVNAIYVPGAIVSFVIMLISMVILRYVIAEQGVQRILLVYIIIISAAFSVGQAGVATFMDGGLSYYYQWAWWDNGTKILVCVLSVFILVMIGKLEQTAMLLTSTSFVGLLPKKTFQIYFRYQYILPSIAGLLIVYFVKLPSISAFEVMELLSMFIVVYSAYFSLFDNQNIIVTDDTNFRVKRPYVLLAIALLLMLVFRIYCNITFNADTV